MLSCLCVCIAKQLPFLVLLILIDIDYIFVLCSVAVGDASFVDAPERIECTFESTFLPSVDPCVISFVEDSAMNYC